MFKIILRNEKLSSYNKLDLFILLMPMLYFGYYFINVHTGFNFVAFAGCSILSFIGLALNMGCFSRNRQPAIPFWILFILIGVLWGWFGNFWACIILILLGLMDIVVRKKPELIFKEDSIGQKTFPGRTIQWAELNNVILKDNILTVDFKTDKLLQAEIDVESYNVDEGEFNAFCARKFS